MNDFYSFFFDESDNLEEPIPFAINFISSVFLTFTLIIVFISMFNVFRTTPQMVVLVEKTHTSSYDEITLASYRLGCGIVFSRGYKCGFYYFEEERETHPEEYKIKVVTKDNCEFSYQINTTKELYDSYETGETITVNLSEMRDKCDK